MAKKKNPLSESPRKKRSYVGDFDDLMADISDEETTDEDTTSAERAEKDDDTTEHAAADETSREEASESTAGAADPAYAVEEEGSGPPKKHLNLKIDETLHTRFKGIVGMQGRTMTEVLEELMRDYVHESMRDLDL